MTLKRSAAQRPQLYGLSSRRNDWPKPVLQPKGEYLGALIRSYEDFLVSREPDIARDDDGKWTFARFCSPWRDVREEIDRLRSLQPDLSAARAGLLAETA